MGNRRIKKKSAKFRLKLEVDTKDWDTGQWPYDLAKAMKVTTDQDDASVTFEIDDKLWEQASLKIAKEAIEAFFGDGMYVSLTKEGLQLYTDDGNEVLIPSSKIMCDVGRQARDDLVRALNAQSYDDDGHDRYFMDELAKMAEDAEASKPPTDLPMLEEHK